MKQINRISISYTPKSLLLFVFILTTSILAKAQPKPGVMIYGQFETNVSNNFVASVKSSDGKNFTCRFVQSNAVYVFKMNEPGEGTVISNKGGKYPIGSKFVFIKYNISDDTYGCIINRTQAHEIIAKFDDGKSYLGFAGDYKTDRSFTVGFWHSGSTYKFDKTE